MDDFITLVLPNYNHAHYLSRAIQSILTQEHTNFELIIIEDGSTDHSLELLQEWVKQDSRIVLIAHKNNRGIFYSVNEALEAAQGSYFHGLGADDFYLPNFLSTSLKHLLKHPEIGMSACDTYYYLSDPEHKQFYPFTTLPVKDYHIFNPRTAAYMLRQTSLKFSGTNCITQTSFIKKFGGYQEKLNASCDWLLHTKIALTEGVIYIPQPLICWKKNESGISATILRHKKGRRKMYAHVLEDLANLPKPVFMNFKLSGELGCVLKYAWREFLKHPKFWLFLPNILYRFFRRKCLYLGL